ncbi:unnamed protein product, partial [Meganyctiphanes norvegica]
MNIAKLRHSLMRSRTPTGAEMKQQNSLEVPPPQLRSASFDEMQLKPTPQESSSPSSSPAERQHFLLRVPYLGPKRSKSFDSGCGDVDEGYTARKKGWRLPSMDKSGHHCVHCMYLEEIARGHYPCDEPRIPYNMSLDLTSLSSSREELEEDDDVWDDNDSSSDELNKVICGIKVTLSPNSPSSASEISFPTSNTPAPKPKTASPKLERQPAIFCMNTSTELSSQENSFDFSDPGGSSHHGSYLYLGSSSEHGEDGEHVQSERTQVLLQAQGSSGYDEEEDEPPVADVFLDVPNRRDRAASIDLAFASFPNLNDDVFDKTFKATGLTRSISLEPSQSLRSKSIDIELPTEEEAAYKVVVTSPKISKKEINTEVEIQCENGERRVLRSTCDWAETAINGDHLWCPTSASGDFCYVGEENCCKSGPRMKCSACKIIAHTGCIAALVEKVKFPCKPTFRDVGPRQYRTETVTHHHWVHRRNQKGKCKNCSRGFQSKLLFGSKEIVAISCSWCKAAYHNKESCFNIDRIEETCSLGLHAPIIVPPSWIVKLPRRGSFKSSLRKSPKKRSSSKKKKEKNLKDCKKDEKPQRPFAIKPIPSATIRPLIVFINPKSGGNQGAKLMQKFQWLLNPRQVFDLTQGGPKMGLEMFRKVNNLRVLACGGDGTVGWVLSILDMINFFPPPPVGVLPLGTGNDLARSLGWGGGYTDEPISKILCAIGEGDSCHLDRWQIDVKKNEDCQPSGEGKDNLPLNVVNNYFSIGVDAHIALEFHEAREANPQKFNSRLRNKMFYGQTGGKDLLQRKWKDLSDFVEMECDDKDVTHILKEHRVHAIVFLNITSYGSGTHPWNKSSGEQHIDDGVIEVIGLTTYQMPMLQAGGHGTTICQCRTAKITTKKTIPMQVDGEACRVNPSHFTLRHLNKASMIIKKKSTSRPTNRLGQLELKTSRISMKDYEQNHYDKQKLRSSAIFFAEITVNEDADLDQVRRYIEEKAKEKSVILSYDWCFLDSCTAERFFRIDKAQEHLHYVTDICTENIYIMDPEVSSAASANTTDIRGDVSVDNDLDHSERLAMVSDIAPLHDDHFTDSISRIHDDEEVNYKKVEIESQRTVVSNSNRQRHINPDCYPTSHLLEKTSDHIIRASKQGDLKAVKDLHIQGFSLLSIDDHGQTALHFAARHGHKDIVRYLIASAPPSILDMVDTNKGQTALHLAASNRRRTVCCMLVAAGASLSIQDLQGFTPRALAQRSDDQELAAYLESQEKFNQPVNGTLSYID